ncbi:MAG: radical SAM protein [Candidatus Tectomicrobia bacterium]|uniref:Radical SAM protein n=1 Tax=Tectimicrobiota bacterium TaxID=2528274 RepID=A0A932CPX8_UNCTE|nr:radical SAM protein [Candidatus Tectomicrobia bacterium]
MTAVDFELKYVVWSCTKACNFHCLHCAKDDGDPLPNELSTEEAFRLLDQVAELGVDLFVAGVEPLLRPDLLELTGYAAERGVSLYLKTNGWLLDEHVADLLASHGVKVIIGMSGTEELQERIRGKGAYQRALEAARRCSKRGNLLGLSVWLTRFTVDQVSELIEMALSVGAKEFSLADYIPQGRTKEIYKRLAPSPEEYERVLHQVYHLYKELQDRIIVFPYTIFSRRIMKTYEPQAVLTKACSLHDWLEVAEDGKVFSCRSMGLLAGDLRTHSLKEIWEQVPQGEVGELIRQLYQPENIRGKCGQCEYFGICGGCRARAFAYTGDRFASDPACPHRPAGKELP